MLDLPPMVTPMSSPFIIFTRERLKQPQRPRPPLTLMLSMATMATQLLMVDTAMDGQAVSPLFLEFTAMATLTGVEELND